MDTQKKINMIGGEVFDANIRIWGENVLIEIDDIGYFIPTEVFKGIL
jgi:hypothetical protein